MHTQGPGDYVILLISTDRTSVFSIFRHFPVALLPGHGLPEGLCAFNWNVSLHLYREITAVVISVIAGGIDKKHALGRGFRALLVEQVVADEVCLLRRLYQQPLGVLVGESPSVQFCMGAGRRSQ